MEDKYIIDYDISKKQVTDMSFKQGNKNVSKIIFTIYESGLVKDITGETIQFRFLKPDKTLVYLDFNNGVTITDPTNGEVTCELTNDVLSAIGLVRCEIYRVLNDQELYMPSFNFLVKSSLTDEAILSTNYFSNVETNTKDIAELQLLVADLELNGGGVEETVILAENGNDYINRLGTIPFTSFTDYDWVYFKMTLTDDDNDHFGLFKPSEAVVGNSIRVNLANKIYGVLTLDINGNVVFSVEDDGGAQKVVNATSKAWGIKFIAGESSIIPDAPTEDGTYGLQTTVTSGVETYDWKGAEIEDLRFPVTSMDKKKDAVVFDEENVGLLFPQDNSDSVVFIVAQMSHTRVANSDIMPHVHCRLTGAGQPVFKMDYKWYNPENETVPTNWSTYEMNVNSGIWSSGTQSSMIYGTAPINGTGKGDSSIMIIKLYRDDNVYNGDLLVDEFDIHYYKEV